jgi:hypothetical protein
MGGCGIFRRLPSAGLAVKNTGRELSEKLNLNV